MNLYKFFIPKKWRFALLNFFKFIPDEPMLRFQYMVKHHRRLNLKNPKRYTEKIQWYKLYYRNSLMPICVDKYRVREYVKQKGLSDILVNLFGVYDKVDDISFDKFPSRFVMKTTNGSGTNIICKDKNLLSQDEIKARVKSFLRQSDSHAGREWPYAGGGTRVVAEELLEDFSNQEGAIFDYKFLCFNGKPEYVCVDVDRFIKHKRNIYDIEWNNLRVSSDCPCVDDDHIIEKPKNYERMLEIVGILCQDFPHVRVDLYNINGKIYFGELTFFPWSGYVQFTPDPFDLEMGEKFALPVKNK